MTLLWGTPIVASVLKKFIPQKPNQTPPVEDAGVEGKAPALSVPEQKIVTQTNPIMADTSIRPIMADTPIKPIMADTLTKNSLSKDVESKGSIKFVNEFVFDGNLEGEISSADGILTIGENADVRGEVKSKTVIVKGKVQGNVTVHERCELHSRSQLIGDLKAARLVIEEGATFVGKSEVTPNKNIVSSLSHAAKEEPSKPVGASR